MFCRKGEKRNFARGKDLNLRLLYRRPGVSVFCRGRKKNQSLGKKKVQKKDHISNLFDRKKNVSDLGGGRETGEVFPYP